MSRTSPSAPSRALTTSPTSSSFSLEVRDLFKKARAKAAAAPSRAAIVYIDEIDAVGRKRSAGGPGSDSGLARDLDATVNQLLVEARTGPPPSN